VSIEFLVVLSVFQQYLCAAIASVFGWEYSLSKLVYPGYYPLSCFLELGDVVAPPEAHPQGAHAYVRGDIHGGKDVGEFDRPVLTWRHPM
jgi:hypothetical protein